MDALTGEFYGASKRLQLIIEAIILEAAQNKEYQEYSLDDLEDGKALDIGNLDEKIVDKAHNLCKTKSMHDSFSETGLKLDHDSEISFRSERDIETSLRIKKIERDSETILKTDSETSLGDNKTILNKTILPTKQQKIAWGKTVDEICKKPVVPPSTPSWSLKKTKISWNRTVHEICEKSNISPSPPVQNIYKKPKISWSRTVQEICEKPNIPWNPPVQKISVKPKISWNQTAQKLCRKHHSSLIHKKRRYWNRL